MNVVLNHQIKLRNAIKLTFIFFLFCILTNAQASKVNYTFNNIDDNAPQTAISALQQDDKGFVWLSTHGSGLYRYDGLEFKNYKHIPNDSTTLNSSIINTLHIDSNKNLWVGTRFGLNKYNKKYDNFSHIPLEKEYDNIEPFHIYTIKEIKPGVLAIGSAGNGLYLLDTKTENIIKINLDNPKIESTLVINDQTITKDSVVLFATNRGLYSLLQDKRQLVKTPLNDNTGITNFDIALESILTDKAGNVWLGSYAEGIFKLQLNPEKQNVVNQFKHTTKRVMSIKENTNGDILFGTENDGLLVLNKEGNLIKKLIPNKNGISLIPSNSIWSILIDKQNRIWLGFYNKGLAVHDTYYDKFHDLYPINNSNNSLQSGSVTGLQWYKNKEKLLIAMDGGGLDIYDLKEKRFQNLSQKNSYQIHGLERAQDAQTVFVDSKENIWLGTWGSGLYLLTNGAKKFKNFHKGNTKNGLTSNSITSITEDKNGIIWIGTFFNGLHFFDSKNQKFEKFSQKGDNGKEMNIRKVLVDSDNDLWIATNTGLYVIREKSRDKIESYNDALQSITKQSRSLIVQALFQSKDGSLWIGTNGSGLFSLNKKTNIIERWYAPNGLKSEAVVAITEDQESNIWVSGENGLAQLQRDKKSFTNYSKNDGLLSNEFNYNAVIRGQDGSLYFGSHEGVNYFNPNHININPNKPNVVLKDLKIYNQSAIIGAKDGPLTSVISETSSISLNHKQNVFSLDYVGLNFTRPTNNNYAYYLKGLEDKYNYVGSVTNATYTNLSPGNYTFMVKAANNDGVWSSKPTKLQIEVLSPWWASPLAWFIYALLFISGILAIVIYYNKSLEKKRLRLNLLASREQEKLLNERKIQFFTNISHELRTPLTLILNPLQDLLQETKHALSKKEFSKLSIVSKNADRLKLLVDELMDFRKLESNKIEFNPQLLDFEYLLKDICDHFKNEAKQRNIQYFVSIEEQLPYLSADKKMVEKIIFNLLSNAFKATPSNEVITITANRSNKKIFFPLMDYSTQHAVVLKIKDTGSGISTEDLPNIFNRFYQGKHKNESYLGASGSGIGLELTKNFVALHKGKIEVESAIDKGTTFSIYLPLLTNLTIENKIETPKVSQTNNDTVNFPDASLKSLLEEMSLGTAQRSKVLLIEDNYELRTYLKDEFEPNYEVKEAKNGLEALQIVELFNPDIIVTDVVMPHMDGFEFSQKIKKDSKTSHIPIIMLTAKAMPEDQINGLELGADVYLCKPFHTKVLKSYIEKLIFGRQDFVQKNVGNPKQLNLLEHTTEQDKTFMQKVIAYVNKNLDNTDLNVELLADKMCLSRSQLYRKVKAMSGLTPNDLIRKIRMEKAKILIENGAENIGEVCYKVGFSSPSYFSRCFKTEFGVLPTDIKS